MNNTEEKFYDRMSSNENIYLDTIFELTWLFQQIHPDVSVNVVD